MQYICFKRIEQQNMGFSLTHLTLWGSNGHSILAIIDMRKSPLLTLDRHHVSQHVEKALKQRLLDRVQTRNRISE